MLTKVEAGEAPVSLNEARGWLRLSAGIDDGVAAALVRAATNVCEAFTGQWLIARGVEELLPAGDGALRLGARPVVAVERVALVAADGGETDVGAGGYHVRVARDGSAAVEIDDRGAAERVRIAYRAGIADGANGVPEAIRQGILRMTQHLHEARDAPDGAPPAAIAALWQPWRRMTLGGGQ